MLFLVFESNLSLCFRLLNPVLSRLDKSRKKQLEKELLSRQFDPVEVFQFPAFITTYLVKII